MSLRFRAWLGLPVVWLVYCVVFMLSGAAIAAELEEDELPVNASLQKQADLLELRYQQALKSTDDSKFTSGQTLERLNREAVVLQSKAEQCTIETQKHLTAFQSDLKLLGEPATLEDGDIRQKRKKLEQQVADSDQLLKRCQLTKIQISTFSAKVTDYKNALVKKQFFHQELSLYFALSSLLSMDEKAFDAEVGVFTSSVQDIHDWPHWKIVITLGILGYILGWMWRREHLARPFKPERYSSPTYRSMWRGLKRTAPILTALLFIYLYLYSQHSVIDVADSDGLREVGAMPFVSFSLFIFALFGCAQGMLFPDLTTEEYKTQFPKRLAIMAWVGAVLAMAIFVFSDGTLWRFADSVFMTLLWMLLVLITASTFIALLWILSSLTKLQHYPILFVVPALGIMLAAFAALWGYRNLAIFTLFGVLMSLMLIIAITLIMRGSSEFFDALDEGKLSWHRRVRSALNLDDGRVVPGLLWIRIVLFFSVLYLAVISLMAIWGESQHRLSGAFYSLKDGFMLGSMHIEPANLIQAIFVMVVTLSTLPFIKRHIISHWLERSNLSRGARDATLTLLGYSIVAFAIFLSLTIVGVNFQNIAIVAGALSVGIGFGLQNIVNNFVSGLILLFERPIRRGDWIIVGATEGYVQDISIRSTTIQTFRKADVIVPNSELISNQVTNWMLSSESGQVRIPVRVEYGTNTEKVMALLEKIANEHSMVINDNPNFPIRVFLLDLAESALNFELRAFIYEVDYLVQVKSDINLSILREFADASITIPYPRQRLYLHTDANSNMTDIDDSVDRLALNSERPKPDMPINTTNPAMAQGDTKPH